jgi:hypothetical protein
LPTRLPSNDSLGVLVIDRASYKACEYFRSSARSVLVDNPRRRPNAITAAGDVLDLVVWLAFEQRRVMPDSEPGVVDALTELRMETDDAFRSRLLARLQRRQ